MIHRFICAALFPAGVMAASAEKHFVWEGVNPLVRHIRCADPDAVVWNNRVYVFASQDMPDAAGYGTMDGYHVFSSDDLVHWTDHGEILHSRGVAWGKEAGGFMWAPGAAAKNGKYYLYYPHLHKSDGKWRVGVATSDVPGGPYTDQGVVEGVDRNDPACFIDDDGQAYLYWGGGFKPPKMAKLKENMIELAEKPRIVDYGGDNFCEGAFVFKRAGKYYFIYFGGDPSGEKVQARYSVGDSPYGPFAGNKGFAKMPPGAQVHGSIIEFKGQWYYFYHLGNYTDANGIEGSKHRRNVCFDKLYFEDNGSIRPVEYTLEPEGKKQ
jgi:beta-xylosidase